MKSALEGEIDRRARGLKSTTVTRRLSDRAGDFVAALVEDKDVGRERVRGIEHPTRPRALFVTDARQAMPRFEHENLKMM
ncbi:MAG: hypothetical protein JO058_14835 [Alphaproteobacteria bacterium]|nr:hypothetical protein [Alphaproteobacteria bacterium]